LLVLEINELPNATQKVNLSHKKAAF